MSRTKRDTKEYLAAARKLAKFAPILSKYKRRKTLKPHEKGAIARKEKLLAFADHLIPLTKAQARELKDELYHPTYYDKKSATWKSAPNAAGVRAIQLRNTGDNTVIRKVRRDLMVTSNGRTYLYWRLARSAATTRKGMETAAAQAFEMQFPIEQIEALARRAFEKLHPIAVYLWAPSGRVGRGFQSLKQFAQWLYEKWGSGHYTHQEEWVNGIAIWVSENPNAARTESTSGDRLI